MRAYEIPVLRWIVVGLLALFALSFAWEVRAASVQCDGPCICEITCRDTSAPLPPVQPPPVTPPVQPPTTACPTTPGVQVLSRSWTAAFYGYSYPQSGGPLAPIGSRTIGEATMGGKVIAIPFTASYAASGYRKLEWALAQPIGPPANYNPSRKANRLYVSVSRCPGDVSVPIGPCAKYLLQGALYYGRSALSSNMCVIPPGTRAYINIMAADPANPAQDTCSTGSKCEANFRHQ